MMEVKNLCKAYHGHPVLQNLSFAAGMGITAIWAPSGAGKTTLLRLLLGLEKPDGGRLVGTDLRWSAVFQEDRLLEGLDAAATSALPWDRPMTPGRRKPCWKNWALQMWGASRWGRGPGA